MSDQSRIEQELSDSQMSYDSRIEEFIAWLKEDIPTHPEPKSRIEEQLASMTPGGGGSATLIEKTIIQNGIYKASDDEADGYSKVTVNIPQNPVMVDLACLIQNGATTTTIGELVEED